MAEYIKLEAAVDAVNDVYYDTPDMNLSADRLEAALRGIPAADVAPVVRCCDCRHHYDCGTHFCDRLGMDCPDDSEFFCKYGARMDLEAL